MEKPQKQIFLWYGQNDFEISQTLQSWLAVFNKKYTSLNIVKLDLKDGQPSDKLLQELKNSFSVNSLFGVNKLIILKNFLIKTPAKLVEINELLLASLEKLSAGFILVFTQADKPDGRGKLFLTLKKMADDGHAEIKEFFLPKFSEISKWIVGRLKKNQAQMSPRAVDLLVALVGANLWQLDTEIQKLIHYKKGELIEEADVRKLVKGKFNDDIFQLMDAIGQKDKAKALNLMTDQLASGANEMYLFTMLVRQFRLLRQVKELLAQEKVSSNFEIAKRIGCHPFVAQKIVNQINYFTLEGLKKIFSQLLEVEHRMKTTGDSFRLMFDRFIVQL